VPANEKGGDNVNREHKTSTFIREPQAVLVVSDTHFGAEVCAKKAFARFLDWLAEWMSASTTKARLNEKVDPLTGSDIKKGEDQEAEPKPPEIIILLGDFLELWDPRGDDLTQPMRDSFQIFHKLFNLPCKKVYVIGNHDHELVDYGSVSALRRKGDGKSYLTDYACTNSTQFVIARDHYPNLPSDRVGEWLKLGKHYYYFLHGHQLDKRFKGASFLQYTPGWMSRFASTYKSINPWIEAVSILGLGAGIILAVGATLGAWAVPLWLLLLLTVPSLYVAVPFMWVRMQGLVWQIAQHDVVPKYKNVETVARDYFRPEKYKKSVHEPSFLATRIILGARRAMRTGRSKAGHSSILGRG
jgi:hypothetical protein